ncbi:MAG: FtsL-like putative cell division protein [Saprospiraceae bacterium]|nr:FtsL-like putative cell division protein [Saprospiraceae bacterium]
MAKKKKGIKYYTELSFLTSDLILYNLLFVLFLGFLGTIYIANAHYAERNVRQIQVLKKDIKEMRWYYLSLQSENMYNSKRSEVVRGVRGEGLRPHTEEPKKIVVKRD